MDGKKPRAPATAPFYFQVYGHADLRGAWSGWRIRGAWLIAPSGERILRRRLEGILWREQLERRFGRTVADRRVSQVHAFACPSAPGSRPKR